MVDTVVGAVLLFLGVFNLLNLRRGRGRTRTFFRVDRPPAWWAWGGPLWRGWRRREASGALWCVFGGAWMLVKDSGGLATDILLAAVLVSFVLGASVVLVNRPKLLVAEHYRSHPGAIAEWGQRHSDPDA